jgi:hypothetical protein
MDFEALQQHAYSQFYFWKNLLLTCKFCSRTCYMNQIWHPGDIVSYTHTDSPILPQDGVKISVLKPLIRIVAVRQTYKSVKIPRSIFLDDHKRPSYTTRTWEWRNSYHSYILVGCHSITFVQCFAKIGHLVPKSNFGGKKRIGWPHRSTFSLLRKDSRLISTTNLRYLFHYLTSDWLDAVLPGFNSRQSFYLLPRPVLRLDGLYSATGNKAAGMWSWQFPSSKNIKKAPWVELSKKRCFTE